MQNSASGKFLPRLTFQIPREAGMIMKLLTVFILAACIQVHARVGAQTVTYSVKNAPIEKVFKEIKRQTGYGFMYNTHILEVAKPVTIEVDNKSLKEVLDACFKDQPFTYEISNKTVLVKQKQLVERNIPAISTPLSIPPIDVKGRVIDSTGSPLAGASVKVKGTNILVVSDDNGEYEIKGIANDATLVISFIGYGTKEVRVNNQSRIGVMLKMTNKELAEVAIQSYSTGYQTIPKERATGSFDVIDNKTYNRTTAPDVISRLEGVANSLYFNKNASGGIFIRGTSSLQLSSQPLIVLDNFPYVGDYNNINPNDIESVTVLKDAAAASIWGARAGNGVIVLTSKKAKYNQPFQLSLTANTSVQERPNVFQAKNFINSNDFINVEQMLFSKGFYDNDLNSFDYRMISPVVQILADKRNGVITDAQAQQKIDAYRSLDNRGQIQQYLYKPAVNQQYSLSMSGGSPILNYYVSAGYDQANNPGNLVGATNKRETVHSLASFKPNKKLDIQLGIDYSHSDSKNTNAQGTGLSSPGGGKSVYYPYAMLADNNGNHLVLPRDYNQGFKDTAGGGKLLDWNYRPLDEITAGNSATQVNDILFNLSAKYALTNELTLAVQYAHEWNTTNYRRIYSTAEYYTRSQINLFSQLQADGSFLYAMPIGGIVDESMPNLTRDNVRPSLSYNKTWNNLHALNAIAGFEVSQAKSVSTTIPTAYGYQDDILQVTPVNYAIAYRLLDGLDYRTIPGSSGYTEHIDRFVSYFSNISYSYNQRYIISGSIRKDQSNIFGVNTNNRGIPLWSGGISWKLSDEKFYHISFLPKLTIRTTFGYQGNSSTQIPAFATIRYNGQANYTFLPNASVITPPNPDLRWEKIGQVNIGVDFAFKNSMVTGSLEYYVKNSSDLLSNTPVDYTTGFTTVLKNVGGMQTKGIDLSLNFRAGNTSRFHWNAMVNANYVRNKITKYLLKFTSANSYLNSGGSINPLEGHDAYSIFSYRFGGLDPVNGDPQGYINKVLSKNYSSLIYPASLDDLVEQGTGRPPFFGNIYNTFTYKGISFSFNISGKFGWSFRKQSIDYNGLFNGWAQNSDFMNRWQQPGDEKITNVPSMTYPGNAQRDQFYQSSEATILKGDVIRLEDIRLSYDFKPIKLGKTIIKRVNVFCIAQNIGILWKANKEGLDPDAGGGWQTPRKFSVGFNATF